MTDQDRSDKPAQRRKRSRRRYQASIRDLAASVLSPALRQKGFVETEIIARWADIVGHDIARGTVPLRVKFPPGKRVGASLHIRSVAAFAPVVQHRQTHIISAVNSFFGFGAVAKLMVTQGRLPVKAQKLHKKQPSQNPQDQAAIDALVKTHDTHLSAELKALGLLVKGDKGG